jgi:hypothetical protein
VSTKQAPILAAWMLDRLVPGGLNEALEGDLLEELASGRSHSWYWRQVSSAIAVAWRSEISGHRRALMFAALWSMLAPTWLELAHTRAFSNLAAITQQLDWPWSAICPVLLQLSLLHAFLWTGFLLFLGWNRFVTKGFNVQRLCLGLARGTFVLLPVWLATVFVNAFLFSNSWLATVSLCFPFFVAMLCAIWGLPRERACAKSHVYKSHV